MKLVAESCSRVIFGVISQSHVPEFWSYVPDVLHLCCVNINDNEASAFKLANTDSLHVFLIYLYVSFYVLSLFKFQAISELIVILWKQLLLQDRT